MGSYTSTFIGPYVRIKVETIEEVNDKEINCCLNEECKVYKKSDKVGKFCQHCGGEMGKAIITTKSEIKRNANRVFWELDDNITDDEYESGLWVPQSSEDVLIPNFGNDYHFSIDEDTETGTIEIPDASSAIESFKEDYKEDLERLTKAGVEYTVEFGVVVSYN